ncbi:subtilisin-like protein, partial [Rhizophagus irregularis]
FGGRAKFGGSFCDGCNKEDENGHGTHVASIACGATLGVARKATPIAVRVLDAYGSGLNSEIIAGLNFVGETHSKSKSKKSVVNMSLGGSTSKAINDAVKQLTNAGVHVAVAADFSNIGKCLDIFAPGRNIQGANFKADNGSVVFSGTSQATPHVAEFIVETEQEPAVEADFEYPN